MSGAHTQSTQQTWQLHTQNKYTEIAQSATESISLYRECVENKTKMNVHTQYCVYYNCCDDRALTMMTELVASYYFN